MRGIRYSDKNSSVEARTNDRPTIFGKIAVCAIGRLSERESTRDASVYETTEKYRADNGGPPYGRMVASWNCNLHMRTADVWARDRALFSSSARFRGGDDSAAAPPCEKEKRRAGTRVMGTRNGRPVVRNRQLVATHVQHERTREPRFSNY